LCPTRKRDTGVPALTKHDGLDQRLILSRACGVPHPTLITADQLELLDDRFGSRTVADTFGYGRGFGLPSHVDCEEIRRVMSV
jgi:hypothetical protein